MLPRDGPGAGGAAKVRRSGGAAELAGAQPGGGGGSEEPQGPGRGRGPGAEEGPLTEASVAEVLEGLRRKQEVRGASAHASVTLLCRTPLLHSSVTLLCYTPRFHSVPVHQMIFFLDKFA